VTPLAHRTGPRWLRVKPNVSANSQLTRRTSSPGISAFVFIARLQHPAHYMKEMQVICPGPLSQSTGHSSSETTVGEGGCMSCSKSRSKGLSCHPLSVAFIALTRLWRTSAAVYWLDAFITAELTFRRPGAYRQCVSLEDLALYFDRSIGSAVCVEDA